MIFSTCHISFVLGGKPQAWQGPLRHKIQVIKFLRIKLFFSIGVPPKESSCIVNAVMLHHYKRGAYYPKGGSSEIPFHITKVIQKFGGRVLVRAPVNRILVDNKGAAYGE